MPANSPYGHRFRPLAGGSAGAPAALLSAELAFNMFDKWFYVGVGDDGNGNATSIAKAFKSAVNDNNYLPDGGTALQVPRKNAANDAVEWYTPSGGSTYTEGSGIDITGSVISADFAVLAPLVSPAFTNNPTAPTQAAADNSTKLATTAYVTAKVAALLGGAAAAYDTFVELQALMQADDTETAAIITSVSGKLQKDQNLADLTNAATARGNLGLGNMATQAKNAVDITGGTITGVAIRGGTF